MAKADESIANKIVHIASVALPLVGLVVLGQCGP